MNALNRLSGLKALWAGLFLLVSSLGLGALDLSEGLLDTTLPNGLRVVIKPLQNIPLADVRIIYEVGFLDSPEEALEMPHFLEHMLFRETQDYQRGEMVRLVTETGGSQNGYTSLEQTVYLQTVPASSLGPILAMEASRMDRALFNPAALEREKEIVRSEIQNMKASPSLEFFREVYDALGLPWTRLLDPDRRIEQIPSFTVEQVESFYRQYYHPGNATVLIVGGVDPQEALAEVRRHFGGIANRGGRNQRTAMAQPSLAESGRINGSGVVQVPFGARYFNAFPRNPGSPRQLIWEFITASGLVPELELLQGPDYGYLVQNYNEVAPAPLEVLDMDILGERFPEVKERFLARAGAQYDSIGSVAGAIAGNLQSYGVADADSLRLAAWRELEWDTVRGELETLLADDRNLVTHFRVSQASANATDGSLSLGMMDDFSDGVDYSFLESEDPEVAQHYRDLLEETVPRMDSVMRQQLGAWRRESLANGVEVYYQPQGLSNQSHVSLIIRAGALGEDVPFLANFAGSLVLDGGPQILVRNQLENLGGGWQSGTGGTELQLLSLNAESQHWELMTQVLSRTLENRPFSPWLLDNFQEQTILGLANRGQNQDPNYWSWDILEDSLYPEGHPILARRRATAATVTGVNLDQVRAFLARWYRPENMIVAITSDRPWEELAPALESALGSWSSQWEAASPSDADAGDSDSGTAQVQPAEVQPGDPAAMTQAGRLAPPTGTVFRHNLPQVPENIIRLVAPITQQLSLEEEIALNLGYSILGSGGLDGRLFRQLRGREGLGYAVAGYVGRVGGLHNLMHGGYLMVRRENVDRAIASFKREMQRFIDDGPTEVEFLYARNRLINALAFGFQGADASHSTLLDTAVLDRWDSRLGVVERIMAITPQEIQRVFRETLDPDLYQIGIAGQQ